MISSNSNSRIKYIKKLQQKARFRQEEGLFVCEGVRLVTEIPQKLIKGVFFTSSRYKDPRASEWIDQVKMSGVSVEEVSESVMEHLSDTKHPQGILAAAVMPESSPEEIVSVERPLIVCLEHVSDPGNVGTIFRTAEAAGASGIMVDIGTADRFSPKVVRSTMGSIFRIPSCIVDDMSGTLENLASKGIACFAAIADGSAVIYDRADYLRGCAVVIGNEGDGLTQRARKACDNSIIIPMQGATESLNAGMAAGIILFEAARQRRNADMV